MCECPCMLKRYIRASSYVLYCMCKWVARSRILCLMYSYNSHLLDCLPSGFRPVFSSLFFFICQYICIWIFSSVWLCGRPFVCAQFVMLWMIYIVIHTHSFSQYILHGAYLTERVKIYVAMVFLILFLSNIAYSWSFFMCGSRGNNAHIANAHTRTLRCQDQNVCVCVCW